MPAHTEPWKWHDIGPHGFYDLVRMARRGRSTLVRMLYVFALFAALAVVHHNADKSRLPPGMDYVEGINHNARIARDFSVTILVVQNLVVLILMPIYCAAWATRWVTSVGHSSSSTPGLPSCRR